MSPHRSQRFAEMFERYLEKSGYTPGQIANRSKIKKKTLYNWKNGIGTPRRRLNDALRLAAALNLNEQQSTELLQAAGHPSIEALVARAEIERDKNLTALLEPWLDAVYRHRRAPFLVDDDNSNFVGRARELQTLPAELLKSIHHAPICIQGIAGAGKTTLVIRIAHLLRADFPDGVLMARVDTSDPMLLLDLFASRLGENISKYADLESRSRAFRQLLTNKRALVILDNAESNTPIEKLFPPLPGRSAVLITTRSAELWVTRASPRLVLGPFDSRKKESLKLFAKILGKKSDQKEKTVLMEIAEILGHLPLAVDIAASRIASSPLLSAIDFLERIKKGKAKLDELIYGGRGVRLSLDFSYQDLGANEKQFFAALGVFAGKDFSIDACAYVNRIATEQTSEWLGKLIARALVYEASGRYRLHPLVNEYAQEKLGDDPAVVRMVEYFVSYAESHKRDAKAIELEYENIRGALAIAQTKSMSALFITGANALFSYLESRGLYDEADRLLTQAHQAAQVLGNVQGAAQVSLNLGVVSVKRGDFLLARKYFEQGLNLARQLSDKTVQSAALRALGATLANLGEYARAREYFLEGLEIARQEEQRESVGMLITNLGVLSNYLGDYDQAAQFLEEGLLIAEEVKQPARISLVLTNLGWTAISRGDWSGAKDYLERGLAIAKEANLIERESLLLANQGWMEFLRRNYRQADRLMHKSLQLSREKGLSEILCFVLTKLGALKSRFAADSVAEAFFDEALTLARTMHHRWYSSVVQNERGDHFLRRKNFELAAATFQEALDTSRQSGLREQIAIALYGLAQTAALQGDPTHAARLCRESLEIFDALKHRQAQLAREFLSRLSV